MIDEIQNGGRSHLEFIIFGHFGQISIFGDSRLHFCKISFIYVNQRLSYCCLCKNSRCGRRRHLGFYFCL